jgi:transposase-like protein
MAAHKGAELARVASLRYWRASDAAVVVEAWGRSGEGLSAFARRHGIDARRLSRWAKELGGSEEPEKPVTFHPVRLVAEKQAKAKEAEGTGGGPLEIILGGDCTVRVAPGFAAEDLARVLEVLGAGAAC